VYCIYGAADMTAVSGLHGWEATESFSGSDAVSCRRHKLVLTSSQSPSTSNQTSTQMLKTFFFVFYIKILKTFFNV